MLDPKKSACMHVCAIFLSVPLWACVEPTLAQKDPATPDSSEPTLAARKACDDPSVQPFARFAPAEGAMAPLELRTCANYRYTVCTNRPAGEPHLYGRASAPPTTTEFDVRSTDVGRPDCISFETRHGGTYHLGIYGAAAGTAANIWVASSPMDDFPREYARTLRWPMPECHELVTEKYSPFNAAWGNDADLNRPFFDGFPDYLHGGVDIVCPIDTPVLSPCNGKIANSNDAGGAWGWYTAIECAPRGGVTISMALIHVNQASTLPAGTPVVAGQQVGTIFPLLEEPGEEPHLHITMSRRPFEESSAAGMQPQRGACRRTEWPSARLYWFNPLNPKLYVDFPGAP